jgi:hypothetical protein
MSDEIKRQKKHGFQGTLYKDEYCQELIKHRSQGYSFESFGAVINCGRKTLFEWCHSHPEFKEAKYIGHEKAKKIFETILLTKLTGKDSPSVNVKTSSDRLLEFALKTRFKESYSERIEVAQAGEIKIVIDQNDSEL